ncbi:hypothetical protein G7054_g6517 [Neopestalotiopsis clavispora]|nr:hypothetical protein G7054_g6517 [Neopestalotiopsis clavispora]
MKMSHPGSNPNHVDTFEMEPGHGHDSFTFTTAPYAFSSDAGGLRAVPTPNAAEVQEDSHLTLNASTDPDASRRGQNLSSKSAVDTICRSFGETSLDIVPPATQAPHFTRLLLRSSQAPLNVPKSTGDSRFSVATSESQVPDEKLADICVNAFSDNVGPDFMLFH